MFQEPEKFTVKKAEKATTEFWSAPKKKEVKLYVYIIKIEKYNLNEHVLVENTPCFQFYIMIIGS